MESQSLHDYVSPARHRARGFVVVYRRRGFRLDVRAVFLLSGERSGCVCVFALHDREHAGVSGRVTLYLRMHYLVSWSGSRGQPESVALSQCQ